MPFEKRGFQVGCPVLLFASILTTIDQPLVAQESSPTESGSIIEAIDFADAKTEAERWLPSDALAYIQIAPADTWLNHPLREQIAQSKPFQQIWSSPDVLNARTGLLAAEWATGIKLETFLKDATAGGAYAAIDSDRQGIVILARAKNERWLQRTLDKLLEFARKNQSAKEGADGSLRSAEYRGIKGYKINELVFAQIGPWLMLSSRNELAKSLLDRHLDNASSTLADAAWRVSKNHGPRMIRTEPADNAAPLTFLTAEFDLARARNLFSTNDLFRKQSKDFGAELLLGGVLALLQNAPSAAWELRLEPNAISTQVSIPTEMEWFSESREHYVGPQGRGRARPRIEMQGALASLSTYRNLSEMWLRAGDLFDQQVNDQLAQADNTLTTLFSGRDFGSDILGAIEPELRLVAVPQTWEDSQLQPTLKLPAFAMVAQLKQPEVMRKELKRIFQSFVGFLNIVGAMEGQPQLDLMSDNLENGPIYWAEYVVDADRKYENGLPIQHNFTPAIAFFGNHVVLASSSDLARRLISESDSIDADATQEPRGTNTSLVVDASAVQQTLLANRENLIAQNMLEKGHSRAQAVKEIDQLLNLLELVEHFQADLSFDTRSSIDLRVDYR